MMKDPAPLAVMMIGIPASGKSAIAYSLSDRLGLERISADDLIPRDEQEKRIYRSRFLRHAWLQVWRGIGRCIKEGRPFLLDAMLLTNERRNPVIGTATGAGFAAVGVFVNTPVEICLIRNSLRKDRVSDGRLFGAASRLQPPNPDEGWTALYRIDRNLPARRWIADRSTEPQLTAVLDRFEPALRTSTSIAGFHCGA